MRGDPRQNPRTHSPDQEQQEHRGQEVVALVVQQVVDDAVVPPVQVADIRHGEPGRAEEKVIKAAEGWRLHVYHLFPWLTIRLAFPECCAAREVGGAPPEGVCATVSDALAACSRRFSRGRAPETRERGPDPQKRRLKTRLILGLGSFFSSVFFIDDVRYKHEARKNAKYTLRL